MNENRKKRLIWQLPFLLLLIVGTVFIIHQQHAMPYQKSTGKVFGTFYTVTYQYDEDLQQQIEEELQKIDAEFSMFNEKSTVSSINRGETPILSPIFLEVYQLAENVSRETDGAFDITVAPLVNAWGFGFKNQQMPTRHEVDSLRQLIGWQHLKLNGNRLEVKKSGMMLDFSAIAKGYGVDAVCRLLQQKGVTNFMVDIGGEVTTRGINPKRIPWKIGVTKPTDDSLNINNEIVTVLNVTDRSMATSGNYRRFYEKGGKRYAHTIDPKTGYPVQHSLLSATVLANNCATADAYATSFMVMGLEKAKHILQQHSDLLAYLIYSDANGELAVWYSPELSKNFEE